MKLRKVAIYIVILGLLLGYYYYYEVHVPSEKKALKEKASRVFAIDKDKIDYLDIKGTEHVVLEKKDHGWMITKPLLTRADKATVGNLLADLVGLKMVRSIGSGKDRAVFGLDRPGLRLILKSGQKQWKLVLGDKTPTGMYRYATSSTKKGIFLVNAYEKASLDKGLYTLRYKRVVELSPGDVDGLRIEREHVSLNIKKDKNGLWSLAGHKSLKVKQDKINSLVRRLCWLEAKAFPGHVKGVDMSRPSTIVFISSGKKSETLKFWDRGSHLYMVSSNTKGLVELSRDILDDIPGKVEDIQDRTFIHFATDDTRKINLSYGSKNESVLVKKGDDWFYNNKKVRDQWKVDELLLSLEDLEYKKVLGNIPNGPLDVCTIKLYTLHDNGNLMITFYKGGYARCGSSTYLADNKDLKRCLDAAKDVSAMLQGNREKK